MDAPPQPSHSSPDSASPSSPSTPLQDGGNNRVPPKAGLLAAQALLNHNRRVDSGLSRSAAPRKRMTIRDAAAKWGASRTAIARQLKSLTETNRPFASDKPPGRPRALAPVEEAALAAFCVYLAQGNCMGNIPLVHKAANDLRARRSPPMGPCHRRWVCRWLMERKDLTLRNIPRADTQYRIEGNEEEVVKQFFDRYFHEKIEKDRAAVQQRLGNGERIEAPSNQVASGDLTGAGSTQHVPLDPQLAGLEERGAPH